MTTIATAKKDSQLKPTTTFYILARFFSRFPHFDRSHMHRACFVAESCLPHFLNLIFFMLDIRLQLSLCLLLLLLFLSSLQQRYQKKNYPRFHNVSTDRKCHKFSVVTFFFHDFARICQRKCVCVVRMPATLTGFHPILNQVF